MANSRWKNFYSINKELIWKPTLGLVKRCWQPSAPPFVMTKEWTSYQLDNNLSRSIWSWISYTLTQSSFLIISISSTGYFIMHSTAFLWVTKVKSCPLHWRILSPDLRPALAPAPFGSILTTYTPASVNFWGDFVWSWSIPPAIENPNFKVSAPVLGSIVFVLATWTGIYWTIDYC